MVVIIGNKLWLEVIMDVLWGDFGKDKNIVYYSKFIYEFNTFIITAKPTLTQICIDKEVGSTTHLTGS